MLKLHRVQITLNAELLLEGWHHLIEVVEEYYEVNYGMLLSISEMDIAPVIPLEAVDDLYILYTVTPTKYAFEGYVNNN